MTDAVLITGGRSDSVGNTTELYLPSSGLSCSLPRLPDNRYYHSVDSSGLLCGGGSSVAKESCLKWRPDAGTWEKAVNLEVRREDHVSWTPCSGVGTYLMGGYFTDLVSTLIKPDGTQEPGFPLKYIDT